jgi:hypothetical protein
VESEDGAKEVAESIDWETMTLTKSSVLRTVQIRVANSLVGGAKSESETNSSQ